MKPQVETATGISITNACYQCQLLQDLCLDCEESRQAKDADIAHQIVDERNLIYPRMWVAVTEPSAHDWVASVTRLNGKIRNEFAEPTTSLIDRIFNLEDSITLEKYEIICDSCHMVTNKNTICPNCN